MLYVPAKHSNHSLVAPVSLSPTLHHLIIIPLSSASLSGSLYPLFFLSICPSLALFLTRKKGRYKSHLPGARPCSVGARLMLAGD